MHSQNDILLLSLLLLLSMWYTRNIVNIFSNIKSHFDESHACIKVQKWLILQREFQIQVKGREEAFHTSFRGDHKAIVV